MAETQEYDVLIVGAGFAGIHQLIHLRKRGFTAKILEMGEDLGGTWYWNVYPGIRVDVEHTIYQFSDAELWKDWTWKELFPSGEELQAYFRYVDRKCDVRRDVMFNSRVASAIWDEESVRWSITTEDGRVLRAQFLSLCTGIASKPFIPPFKGIGTFSGELHHSARWPADYDFSGKRVGVVGTGSSGVEVIQEIAPLVEHLTVYQRTPCVPLPLRQKQFSAEEQEKAKKELYPIHLARQHQTFSGLLYDLDERETLSLTAEERRLYFEEHDEFYAFWRKKILERISDYPLELQEKLAPLKPPFPWGVRRPSLETSYYEAYRQSNVKLVDVNENAIEEITPGGLRTSDGTEHKLDALIIATGFDMVTGGITSIDIRGQDGVSIKDKWANGVQTYLGLASANYPNAFWINGPHAPSALSNAPCTIEITSNWIIDCIQYMKENGISRIVPTEDAQQTYSDEVQEAASKMLWSGAKRSDYMGSNIPRKHVQMLHFTGGVPAYAKVLKDAAEEGYEGFDKKP
ncbi:cyclohexanone monooxygenase [Mycena leptocephala]|nr:cyclohexanone monooxygenase [Mycena leptocephala]